MPYPPEPWTIREVAFDPALAVRSETIFALGNGSLGMRGAFEEGFPGSISGTYLNGFYDETPIQYGETAYAFAKNRQVMLNLVDGKGITLAVGGEPFDLSTGTILSFERCLDMRAGTLRRSVRWRSPRGLRIELSSCRLVCLRRPRVAAIDWTVTLLDEPGTVEVRSWLDGDVRNQASGNDPRKGSHFTERPLRTTDIGAEGLRGHLVQETRSTRFVAACAVEHGLDADWPREGTTVTTADGDRVEVRLALRAQRPGLRLHLTKYLAYASSREATAPGAPADPLARARLDAVRARDEGFSVLLREQEEALEEFWSTADVELDGDEPLQQGLRFNLFSLFQSAGRDGRTSIAAKGLTGEGYEGHYFWDTEIYVLPFFTYTRPEIARALLGYRCSILDKARARAAEMSQAGALFPWRTIGGEETSPFFPAGTAQYHINADIAHALRLYVTATADHAFLLEGGAEMLFETARLWADLGDFVPRRGGAFCINEVTGPDEYSALVNNNLYTNLMARENLAYAAETARGLQDDAPGGMARIARDIGLSHDEPEAWTRAAEHMCVPWDAELGVNPQDDSFLDRVPWDFEGTPAANHPLLLHYHYLVIYRYQVLKQPDVVLAQVLLGNTFSLAQKKRNFDYYDPLTTGDSSLSACIQSVAAAELGYDEKAYAYFSVTARMDLDDINGNVEDGVHTAAMAGTWISVVYGFAGMRDYDGELSFSPRLPAAWRRLRFRLLVRGRLLQVLLTRGAASFQLLEGASFRITCRGAPVALAVGAPAVVDLAPRLQCVVFDLDGVLTDTAELHFQAWARLSKEEGFPFDRAVNEHLRGVGRQDSLRTILRHAGRDERTVDVEGLSERKNGYYRELIETLRPGDLLPGMEGLLKDLRISGIKVAIASASRNAPRIVELLGIGGSVDYVVDAAKVLKGKPDPEVFFKAAEGARVPLSNCVGVEDARVGIQAIRAAGMFSVGIGSSLTEADWVLPDTRGLTLPALRAAFEARARA